MATDTSTNVLTMKQANPAEVWAAIESDDIALMKDVQATHAPDGRKVDVKTLLRIIDGILLRPTTPTIADVPSGIPEEIGVLVKDKTDSDYVKLRAHADIINKVSYELVCCDDFGAKTIASGSSKQILSSFGIKMACKCLSTGSDVQAKTMALLKILSNYSWDAKVVLVMAAFVTNYGDFLLFSQSSYAKTSFSRLNLLWQLRNIAESTKSSKEKFDAILKLVKVIMGITKSIVDFNDLPLDSLASEEPRLSIALSYVPKAAYWTILNVVVCASQIAALNRFQESTTELSWDLINWADQGLKIQEVLKMKLTICKEQADEKSITEYMELVKIVNRRHEDNLETLRIFFPDNGRQHLTNRANRRISIDELKKKNVLLLISGPELSKEEISTLEKRYLESQTMAANMQYQIVWLPIVDESITWDHKMYQEYERSLLLMPWYTVQEPSKIKPEVVKYIKKQWRFENKMMLVPIDAQGNVQSLTALEMLLIKGKGAFPFTNEKEESILENQSWSLELLFGGIDEVILNKKKEGKIVCIFGGEDIEWIREFTRAVKIVEQNTSAAIRLSFELVCVGKSSAMKQVEKIIKIIDAENLGLYRIESTTIWQFWTRLESILYLKMKQGKNFKNDEIMREVTTLLSYSSSDKGWALFCGGSSEMPIAKGDVALNSMKQLNEWWTGAPTKEKSFLQALSKYFQQYRTVQYCHRIILTGNRWEIPSKVLSSEGCECTLEKCLIYCCCAE